MLTQETINAEGFVLTTQTIRGKYCEQVEIWVATSTGAKRLLTAPQQPVAFCLTDQVDTLKRIAKSNNIAVTFDKREMTTLTNEDVTSVKTTTESAFIKLRQSARLHDVTLYESDIKLADRFLMERFVYGSLRFQGHYQHSDDTIHNVKVKPSRYMPSLKVLSVDIECDEFGYLYSIAMASETVNQVLMNGVKPRTTVTNDTFSIRWLADEKSLLLEFIDVLLDIDPDVLIGWNIKQFDLPLLEKAAKRHAIPFTIGRQRRNVTIRQWENNKVIVDIPGRSIVDGIEGLKTMTYHFDSFSLNNVASELLHKEKLIHEKDQLAAIKALYQDDKETLAAYNHQDCVLVNDIAKKTKLIDFLILRSHLTGLPISRPGGSVAAFLNLYLPKMHRAGFISPNRPDNGGLASPGGYVMSSTPGLYRHVLVLDFKSLYPSIIRTFKIDPVGLAEGLKDPENAIEGYKGACFSRDKHYLPAIIENLWKQRDEAKKQQDSARSQAIKILMNSFYGVLGSGGCPLYDPRLASSITLRGHDIMQTTASWIEEQGYDVIYGDTDSTFVHLKDCESDTQAQDIGRKLQSMVNTRWQNKIAQEHGIACHLEIEFETHYQRFFMPTIRGSELGSKKRYVGFNRYDNQVSLTFKGLENVRSDWTDAAKSFQKALFERVFQDLPVEDFIVKVINSIKSGEQDTNLIYQKRLRKPLSEYTRTAPPHVKAARHANECAHSTTPEFTHAGTIRYVMTLNGPQTLEYQNSQLDYDHYIEKQIRPIAESILGHIGIDFEPLVNQQLGLF